MALQLNLEPNHPLRKNRKRNYNPSIIHPISTEGDNLMVELLIKNAKIVDGSGQPARMGDVAVDKGRIIDIGSLANLQAGQVIDGTGKVVCPGFIDMHSHEDMPIAAVPEADSLVQQGITTVVSGQCGSSPAPLIPRTRAQMIAEMNSPETPVPYEEWGSFGSFLDYLEKIGISLNVQPLVGQGTIRASVMGYGAGRPNEEQLEEMQGLVVKSLEEGAFGISTGLIYPPGSYASTAELIELTRPVGERGGFYFSHVRGEGHTLLDSIREEIEIGRKTGAILQHSHYKASGEPNWGNAVLGLEMIEEARKEGLDISADMYPYTASSTSLGAMLPEWVHDGGREAAAQRLSDPATRLKIVASMQSGGYASATRWDKVLISDSPNPEYIGGYVTGLAEKAHKDPYDWVFDALLETQGLIEMINFGISEDNVRLEMVRPWMMIGTDGAGYPFEGPWAKGVPHPRSFGTFPRVMGKYVREEKILTLEEAVHKTTGAPAQKLHLKERGLLKKGYKADLVVFDPATIIDKAEFTNPFQRPVGIDAVIVNGKIVVKNGIHTHARPGVIVSRE
jgi:N-acyl-D-amino-acid deacylase